MHSTPKVLILATAGLVAIALASCGGGDSGGMSTGTGGGSGFVAAHLVSNVNTASNPDSSSNADPHLVNAWGIAFNPQGFVWVANNGTPTSTLYDGNGVAQSLVVAIPPGNAGPPRRPASSSTGDRFPGHAGGGQRRQRLHLRRRGRHGFRLGADRQHDQRDQGRRRRGAGKVYKGLAIAAAGSTRLFAADFHNGASTCSTPRSRRWSMPGGVPGPRLAGGYAPFGIQAIGNQIYVAYAQQDATAHDPVTGPGLGSSTCSIPPAIS